MPQDTKSNKQETRKEQITNKQTKKCNKEQQLITEWKLTCVKECVIRYKNNNDKRKEQTKKNVTRNNSS